MSAVWLRVPLGPVSEAGAGPVAAPLPARRSLSRQLSRCPRIHGAAGVRREQPGFVL